jgi:hypothetical protein
LQRKQNFQTIAWLWDLSNRKLLDLDPPYQRRSVWNQTYRDYYVDTILLGYPSPALFLFERITPEGQATYFVVDGKQRLSTIFAFLRNAFPISDSATRSLLRGLYFRDVSDDVKREVWSYQFTVEYLPSDEEGIISSIFDRINRNTAKLTPQELRHAQFSGQFIAKAEDAAERLFKLLGDNFPNIASQQKRQMKDVEFVANLLLLLEQGPQGYSASQLDEEFSKRDDEWAQGDDVIARFDSTTRRLRQILETSEGAFIRTSRLRNQADFYSLFGAVALLADNSDWDIISGRLKHFIETVNDDDSRTNNLDAQDYYEAARSASNDAGPRKTRIAIMGRVVGIEAP